MAPKLLLYAWDAADWPTIHSLVDRGEMPNLAGLMQRCAIGDLAASLPLVSPMLWASVFTGKTANAHGIVQLTEPHPFTGELTAPSRWALRARTLWSILSDAGLLVHTVGWPVTHPAEHLSGVNVSDAFGRITTPADQAWPITPDAVWPAEVEQELANLRVHPGDLTGNDLLYFVPELTEIDQAKDQRLLPLAVALAETFTLHAAATWILEHKQWDVVAACSPLIGSVSRAFEGASKAACRFQDLLLGRLLDLAGDQVRVMIVLQCGPAGKAHGLFCFAGPGVVKDDLVHGARALDIVPTVLASFDLPVGDDMPGRVLVEAMASMPALRRTPTWESVHSEQPVDDEPADPMGYLTDLGYVDPMAEKVAKHQAASEVEGAFFLGCSHLAADRPNDAIPLLERVIADQPHHPHAGLYLAYAYVAAERPSDCAAQLEKLPEHPLTALVRARLTIFEGRLGEAINLLLQIEEDGRWTPFIGCHLGDSYRACGRYSDAERCYREVIATESGVAAAHLGLGHSLYAQHQFEAAMEAALEATRLRYDMAPAHFLLGAALMRLGFKNYAATALRTCLKLAPKTQPAVHLLARIHSSTGPNASCHQVS